MKIADTISGSTEWCAKMNVNQPCATPVHITVYPEMVGDKQACHSF